MRRLTILDESVSAPPSIATIESNLIAQQTAEFMRTSEITIIANGVSALDADGRSHRESDDLRAASRRGSQAQRRARQH